jgi:hypothetical protein
VTDGDLFSAGFAWGDATGPSEIRPTPAPVVSQSVATASATAEAPDFSANFAWESDAVADVADVADVAEKDIGSSDTVVSHAGVADVATPDATPETAVFCGSQGGSTSSVASVASVANWKLGIELMANGRRPEGMQERAWRELVMDARILLQNWGPDLVELGWTTLEVFGVNPNWRHRRLDVPGLAYLLRGRPVEAIDADTALIRANRVDTMTFQRRLIAAGGVPVWNWIEGARQ